ncbi:MAG: DUF6883 domain-containing protein [Betaproteobacteria bacterium]
MNLPNADSAVIDRGKVTDYLLSPSHPVGRFKSAFFASLGYSANAWELLLEDIRELARIGEAAAGHKSPYGSKFEVYGDLSGPAGRSAAVVTVWIVRTGEDFPRFITAFPR